MAAVEQLSDDDLQRLHRYAALMVFARQNMLSTIEPTELLHEAIARTLDGRRKWKLEKVGFALHLRGCIRSIVHEYTKEAQRHRSGEIEELQDHRLDLEENAFRRKILGRTRDQLSDVSPTSAELFDLLLEGHSAGDIQKIMKITEKEYHSLRREIAFYLHRQLYSREGLLKFRAKRTAKESNE